MKQPPTTAEFPAFKQPELPATPTVHLTPLDSRKLKQRDWIEFGDGIFRRVDQSTKRQAKNRTHNTESTGRLTRQRLLTFAR